MSFLSQPKPPTEEQKAILASDARITVVRACPGAGKTEVFVETIRKRLRGWDHDGCGLAALSFTNIARETIENRMGGPVPAPHFVGTLDSFVFRFIVKPFAHVVGLPQGAVRLFPAAVADTLEEPLISVGNENYQRASIFSVHFCGLSDNRLRISARLPKIGNFDVPASVAQRVLTDKQRFWKGTGIVTHSDCHFLASRILLHSDHGRTIRDILARRFPVVFIDELQDTGFFLAAAFLALFSEEHVSGLVVGDPNQAIYGFGGASPSIFNDFEKLPGAKTLRLKLTQRCPKAVAKVVTTLSASGEVVESLPLAPLGSACLVVHDLNSPTLTPPQVNFVRGLLHGRSLAVVARKTSTANGLKGADVRDEFQGKSKAARRLNLAVQHLLGGEPREAFRIVETELCRIILGDERASAGTLREKGISSPEWRAAIFRVLTTATRGDVGESWNGWVGRVKEGVKTAAESLRWTDDGNALRSYMICNKTGNAMREGLLDVAVAPVWNPIDTVTTIHKVKGAEFDTVVLFVPKAPKGKCPSIQWWSDADGGEERRIAFVAASRAKQRFILCLHKSVFEAMKRTRPEFIACFDPPTALPSAP
jgi:DNA helicase II / ATP-dependent DNA helicase PcrA